eukprot:1152541-Pelagomonas_calceolata.AAC.5
MGRTDPYSNVDRCDEAVTHAKASFTIGAFSPSAVHMLPIARPVVAADIALSCLRDQETVKYVGSNQVHQYITKKGACIFKQLWASGER